GIVRQVVPAPIRVVAHDVVHLRAGQRRQREATTDLHALGRGNTHERLRDARAEAAVPLAVAAEADWPTRRHHLENATAGIPLTLAFEDALNHALGKLGIGAAQLGGLHALPKVWV